MNEELVRVFCSLITIPSESGQEHAFQKYLAQVLCRKYNAEIFYDVFGNLIAKISSKNSKTNIPLLLGMHTDTVAPGVGIKPIVDADRIRTDGSTILGADDKAGIAELLVALNKTKCHPPLEIVLTREEERGLRGSNNLDFSLISAHEGFVLDMDDMDSIVIGGPSKINLDIQIKGKASHAAMDPEKGISAIRAAALAISVLPQGRIDAETTCNIGIINGGENRNSVPETVSLQAEVRSLDHDKAVILANRFLDVFQEVASSLGASVSVATSLAYKASSIPDDSPVVLAASAAIKKVGLSPKIKKIVGGTDASAYNEHGISCAVLGVGARQEHSKEEYVLISDMVKGVNILCSIFENYSR